MTATELASLLQSFVRPGVTTSDEVDDFLHSYTDDQQVIDRAVLISAVVVRTKTELMREQNG